MGEYYFSAEDADYVRSAFTPMMAVELAGLKTKKTGGTVSILCPVHNDRHFGSCKLTKDGRKFQCFVCDKQFGSIDLLMAANGESFYDALAEAAEFLGEADRFRAKGRPKEPETKYRVLNHAERALLGFEDRTTVKWESSYGDEKPREGKYYSVAEFSDDDDPAYYYVGYEDRRFDPLRDLAGNAPDEYRRIVRGKAYDAWDRCRDAAHSSNPLFAPIREEFAKGEGQAMKLFLEFGGDRRLLTKKGRDAARAAGRI